MTLCGFPVPQVVPKKLDMSPAAVDDMYTECRDKMLKTVIEKNGLLEKEIKENKEFREQWSSIKGECNPLISGVKPQHMLALRTFGEARDTFRENFNKFVENKGINESIYTDEFPFKSLHFLLMDALRLYNTSNCSTVFYGTEKKYSADKGDVVRLGRFLSVNRERTDAVNKCVEGGSLFIITSCSSIDLEKHACLTEEDELLLSPTEVFKVEEVRSAPGDDESCDKEIILTHEGFQSNHDCYLFSASRLLGGLELYTSSPPNITLQENVSLSETDVLSNSEFGIAERVSELTVGCHQDYINQGSWHRFRDSLIR
ncbi:ecto-ADP-ribosyltransferase 5-like [Chanos chanos]|uniref:NAD(P)(+)--arginine ADP-ribosyltransferase n=1 Tax=Chanos chanos TaxID=29144 RepID=A0A6J2WE11_CHACN|nr:ecto-ADP-ribosyltransferase 5-like [Chanos chanos]